MPNIQKRQFEGLDSRTQLILVGEALFATHGIDGVSLRRIAAQAGQKNHHAVQYHFTSREGLVQAIFDFRMNQMDRHRQEMLDAARSEGRTADHRTIADIIFVPQLAVISQHSDFSYAGFLSQYLLRNSDAEFGRFGGNSPPGLAAVMGLLREQLRFLSDVAAQRRLISVSFMFLNLLTVYTRDLESGWANEDFGEALEDTMQQVVAALFLPLPGALSDPSRARDSVPVK